MVAPRNFNANLSDEFLYNENIYAAYLQLDRDWEKWAMAIGLQNKLMWKATAVLWVKSTPRITLSYSSNIAITNQVNEQLIDIELPSIH
jgi:hypothetical protein